MLNIADEGAGAPSLVRPIDIVAEGIIAVFVDVAVGGVECSRFGIELETPTLRFVIVESSLVKSSTADGGGSNLFRVKFAVCSGTRDWRLRCGVDTAELGFRLFRHIARVRKFRPLVTGQNQSIKAPKD